MTIIGLLNHPQKALFELAHIALRLSNFRSDLDILTLHLRYCFLY